MSEDVVRVLVVDDDADLVAWLVERLGADGASPALAAVGETDPRAAVERVGAEPFDIVVMDVEMPGLRGLDAMERMHVRRPGLLVVLMTGFGSIDLAVQGLRAGASDFVTKPFPLEQMRRAVRRAVDERSLRREVVRLRAAARDASVRGEVVARSEAMRVVMERAHRAARARTTVLITGESGVGKGAVARAIHDATPDRAGPFVAVNCAALPAQLVESELFGVRRGAFTDARADREGRFVEADGGTLFLDEIGDLPPEVQPKLLHVLESGTVRPLGGASDRRVDARVIAATNVDLDEAVRAGRFRADLLYRLDVLRIHVPPLRARREDVLPLFDVALERACARVGRTIHGVSQEALRWLLAHDWPGNVRELANAVERAVVLAEHDTLVLDDFVPTARERVKPAHALDALVAARWTLGELEQAYTDRVLAATGDNKSEAARLLGIDRRTLHRHLEARRAEEPGD